jgi:dinuclear metal center YbgI/SA1388 family protein
LANFGFLDKMNLEKLVKHINKILPESTAMDGDRIGLQLQSGKTEIRKLLTAFELCDEVIDEALEIGADCIIAFHPLIWRPLTEIISEERVGNLVTRLISSKIALITVHTTFDSHPEGTGRIFSDRLGLVFDNFLVPDKNLENFGLGVIGHFEKAMSPEDFIKKISDECFAPVKYTQGKSKEIRTVALLPGSGSSMTAKALEAGVDAYVTADCTYHQFHAVAGKMWLCDPGHYEMEQFVAQGIYDLLKKTMSEEDFTACSPATSKIRTNPVDIYPGGDEFSTKQKQFFK